MAGSQDKQSIRSSLLCSDSPSDNIGSIRGVVRFIDEMVLFHQNELQLSPAAKDGLATVCQWIGDALEGVEQQLALEQRKEAKRP